MTNPNLVIHNDELRYRFQNDNQISRLSGQWVDNNQVKNLDDNNSKKFSTIFTLLRSLPGWPLVDGINMRKSDGGFIPDNHQFLPMDMLASGWLSLLGINNGEGITRTRVLIADEGGTGKTLTASLAIRYATIINSGGPVIVLVPPLLIDHWYEHLNAVFFDEPERIEKLSSAKFFNETHYDRIVIVSKWSWSKHFENHVKKHIDDDNGRPCCVLIDEVHQGRTGNTGDWETYSDIKHTGAIGLADEDDDDFDNKSGDKAFSSLRSSMRYTCRRSKYAVGVSATPINLDLQELNNTMDDLSADGYTEDSEFRADEKYTKLIGKLMKKSRKGLGNKTKRSELFKPILKYFSENSFPELWSKQGFSSDDFTEITEWLQSDDVIESDLALRILKELHPYGKHLSITLRSDLNNTDNFRTRKTFVLDCKSGKMTDLWNEVVGKNGNLISEDLDKLRQPSLIFNSHRTNIFRFNNEGSQMYSSLEEQKQTIQNRSKYRDTRDERVFELLNIFKEEASKADSNSDLDDIRENKIGAVFFSEWLGTIKPEGLQQDIEDIAKSTGFENIEFKIDVLNNGLGLESLRKITEKMQRYALKKGCFPILICSPAGEVGIEMPWASNLIHWDLNPNPQRLEQRTWRLDRRMRDGQRISKEYRVFFPRYTSGNNIFEVFKKKIEDRWKKAAIALGLDDDSEYICNKTNQINRVDKSTKLAADEIIAFQNFVKSKPQDNSFPIQKQRWKSLFGLMTLGFPTDDKIIDDGIFEMENPMFENGQESIAISKDMSLIRDLETFTAAKGLGLKLTPKYKDQEIINYFIHMSQINNNRGRGLPLFDRLISDIGKRIDHFKSTALSLPKDENDEVLAIAISDNILELHERFRISETGLLLKTNHGWISWDPIKNPKEKFGDEIISIIRAIMNNEYNTVTSPQVEKNLASKNSIIEIETRLKILNQYVLSKQSKLDNCCKKVDEGDLTEDEEDWLPKVIEQTESEIKVTKKKIAEITELYENQNYRIIFLRS